MLPSQNERLAEKLKRIAEKRGADSAQAEELARVESVEGVTPRKRDSVTEKPPKDKKE